MPGKKTLEAVTLHKKGFNCAQAVFLPFCEYFGIDKQLGMRMAEGFGAGMGDCKHTCGALSGAVMVAGLKYCDGNLYDHSSKRVTYSAVRELNAAFEKECGSTVCAVIKGLDTGCVLKSCDECVMVGAMLAERLVNEK